MNRALVALSLVAFSAAAAAEVAKWGKIIQAAGATTE